MPAAVPRMTYPNRWPGDSARMVSARAAAAEHLSGLEMNYRCVVAGVDVPCFQLMRTRPGHRGELGHLTRVALLGRLHDAVEQSVEPLARTSGC